MDKFCDQLKQYQAGAAARSNRAPSTNRRKGAAATVLANSLTD
jgi:hypothetical protein